MPRILDVSTGTGNYLAKAINNDSMKDSVVARLSIQTSEYYSKALDFGNSSDLIKLEWINHLKVKKLHFWQQPI